eukprot:7153493-Pyramimonas_sp.AAC.1
MTPKRKRTAEEAFEERLNKGLTAVLLLTRQVPEEEDRGSDSDSDSSASDGDSDDSRDDFERAEDLALAKKMLRGKEKHRILDDAYNRYNFHDEFAPAWLLQEERKYANSIPCRLVVVSR